MLHTTMVYFRFFHPDDTFYSVGLCFSFGTKSREKRKSKVDLRTFVQKSSITQIFSYFCYSQIMSYLCQKCKKIGGSLTSFLKIRHVENHPSFDKLALVTDMASVDVS